MATFNPTDGRWKSLNPTSTRRPHAPAASFREVLPFPVGGVYGPQNSGTHASSLSDVLEIERTLNSVQLKLTELAQEIDEADQTNGYHLTSRGEAGSNNPWPPAAA